ncbi:DUF4145 domain-containing protein [Aeromicrobium massiliense]|uniref:DUF4145 domain-containing protein n=1 Tax=Aeromicrobium massiliense TaxID=1464554 RepID=UPI0009D935D4|nr:DUF4145 domain-containing protein [Aeromicrobium massiliense]
MSFLEAWLFRDCPHCGTRNTQMAPLAVNTPAQRASSTPLYWSFVACPRCGGAVALRHGGVNDPTLYRTIPEDSRDALQVRHVPEKIARFYLDAVRVLEAGVPDAAAVQLRRTLEGAAAHFEIRERVLVRSIETMIEQGLVTRSFGAVLHHVRAVGNQGAHFTDTELTEEEVRQALRFTTALLRNVFEVPGELAALEQDSDSERDV